MAAKTLGAAGSLLVGIYLDTSKWLWLSFYIPVQNLAGGTFVMIVYSFISDNSTPRERMLRLGIIIWTVSSNQKSNDVHVNGPKFTLICLSLDHIQHR